MVPDWAQPLAPTFKKDASVFESSPESRTSCSDHTDRALSLLPTLESLFYTSSKSALRHGQVRPGLTALESQWKQKNGKFKACLPQREFKASLSNLIKSYLEIKTTQRSGDGTQW